MDYLHFTHTTSGGVELISVFCLAPNGNSLYTVNQSLFRIQRFFISYRIQAFSENVNHFLKKDESVFAERERNFVLLQLSKMSLVATGKSNEWMHEK